MHQASSLFHKKFFTPFLVFALSSYSSVAIAETKLEQLAEKKIVILGDSLTEGYGVAKADAFPAKLEKFLHDQGRKDVKVINAGIGGSTSASGPSRLKWHLRTPIQLLVVALGANDGLRGLKIEETKKNLLQILQLAKQKQIPVVLAGMELPPNYGQEYRVGFSKLYQDLAKTEKVPLIPFLLKDVGGEPSMNQEDGIHPNEKGHEQIAKTVLPYLLKQL